MRGGGGRSVREDEKTSVVSHNTSMDLEKNKKMKRWRKMIPIGKEGQRERTSTLHHLTSLLSSMGGYVPPSPSLKQDPKSTKTIASSNSSGG